jgi:hypothetical protein
MEPSAIMEPFHEFFFDTMESWLSQSLFTNFSLTQWNIGNHGAFSWIFIWHNGISAITEPFHEFFFDTMESRLSRSLFTNILFIRWNLRLSRSLFKNFSLTQWNPQNARFWGKTLFIYITKSIYIGSASLKTLPLDLEPPLQGKEYGPSYSNTTRKRKADFFSRNYL